MDVLLFADVYCIIQEAAEDDAYLVFFHDDERMNKNETKNAAAKNTTVTQI